MLSRTKPRAWVLWAIFISGVARSFWFGGWDHGVSVTIASILGIYAGAWYPQMAVGAHFIWNKNRSHSRQESIDIDCR